MGPDEDRGFTYITLIGTVAGVFADSQNVILLSLALAAASKALPSLYTKEDDSKPGGRLIRVEDWIMFIAAAAGYLLTAGTRNPNYAVAGLVVAAALKAAPSIYRHRRYGPDPEHEYNPTGDQVMLAMAVISAVLSIVTGNNLWATYGVAFSFLGKGLSKFRP
jgi:hypothetical protein